MSGPAPAALTAVVTVVTSGSGIDLVLELGDPPDTEAALTAIAAHAGTSDLVVERTGRALADALDAADLVSGDRLVEPGRRARPALGGAAGPLRGALAAVAATRTIGRGSAFGDRTVQDREVSREHVEVSPRPGGLRARDLGSSNGTRVNGDPLAGEASLVAGDLVEVGASKLVVLGDPPAGHHLTRSGGSVGLNPSAAFPRVAPQVRVDLPAEPKAPPARPFRWLGLLGGIGSGVVMAVLFQSPRWLLLSALGPIVGGLQWWSDRRRGRKHLVIDRAAWMELGRAEVEATWARARDRWRWLVELWPGPAEVAGAVSGWSGRLWSRQDGNPAFLTVRLGSRTEAFPVGRGPLVLDPDRCAPAVIEALTEAVTHDDVPVTLDLRLHRVVGIAGPPGEVGPHVAAWLAHLTALHSPSDLEVGVISAPASTTLRSVASGLRWVPHLGGALPGDVEGTWWRDDVGAGAALEEHLRTRRDDVAGGARWSVIVIEVDAVAPSQLRQLAALAVDVSCTLVWVAPSFAQLPRECSASVELTGSGAATRRQRTDDGTGATEVSFDADRVDPELFEPLCRSLAPLVDRAAADAEGSLPDAVSLAEVFDTGEIDADVIADRWSQLRGISLRLPVAAGRTGTVTLPFPGEVPHGYVVGTTGSGKSVFLQGLVASAAITAPPSAVNLFFIDFRDGAAFRPFEHLPHTVGFLTSLDKDPGLAERAQASLRRELARRGELVSSDLGLSKIEEVWEHHPERRFPRLLIVVDEVQALREQVPDFMDELFDIASRGRGAGVNLLLATQLPRNLPEPIRQLCGLRVALRTESANDSREAVGIAGAERIDPGEQGRAFIAIGSRPAQECRIATPAAAVEVRRGTTVRVLGGPAPVVDGGAQRALNQVIAERFVPDVQAAWTGAAPRPLVLPPLPATAEAPPGAYGLADRPADQWQGPARFDLAADRGAIVLGPVGAGVTATLRQLVATALDGSGAGTDAPVTVLVASSDPAAWADVAAHPRSAGVLDHGDLGDVHHLFERLEALCDERATAPADAHQPLVVAIDDLHLAVPSGEGVAGGLAGMALVDRLVALAERAPAASVHLVLGVARTSRLVKRLLPLVGLHLRLPGGDVDSDVNRQVFGADDRALHPHRRRRHLPPGRAFDRDGVEVQVAAPEQAGRRLAASAASASTAPLALPRLRPLPARLDLADLAAATLEPDTGERIPLGVDRTGLAVGPPTARPFLLVGEAGSGRSNALAVLLEGAHRIDPGRRLVLLTARPSPIPALPLPLTVLRDAVTAAATLPALLADGVPTVVAIEGVEELGGHGSPWTAVTQALVDVVKQGDGRGTWVVGTASSGVVKNALIGGSALGLLGAMAPSRSLVALRPAAEVVGAAVSGMGPFAPDAGAPAGRAALVGGRRWRALHVPRHPGLPQAGGW